MADTKQMIERIDVWQCIGCGKIEAPQPCLGVCRDRKAQLVYGDDYDALANEADALRIIVRHIATVNPRAGECERTWQALQTRAGSARHDARADRTRRHVSDAFSAISNV